MGLYFCPECQFRSRSYSNVCPICKLRGDVHLMIKEERNYMIEKFKVERMTRLKY
jgi:pentose-5-phosphate-3-epimerase